MYEQKSNKSVKQTWTGVLTDVISRDSFKGTVDNLTSISEALGGVISKIGLLKTAIIGIGTVIGSQKLGLFGLLKGNTSGIKNTVQSINQLSQAGKSVRDVNNAVKGMSGLTTNIAVGNIVDVTAVEKYRDAMAGLSAEQQALALSSAGLNAEQAKVVLTYNEGALASTALSEAEATRVLTEAGLVSTIVTLNAEETASLATKTGLSEAVLQQSLVEAGAITTEEEEIIVTNQLNQEHLKAILINHGLVDSEAELVAGYIADTVAKKAATAGTIEFAGATNLLTGALSKLKAVLLAHPIAAILAGIATATVLVVSSVKKHAEEIKKIADEAVDNYESTMNRLTSGKKSFDELSKEYAELSKGVDSLGNNVSLTTDEYEKYHEVANQLANITPSLVKAWDDQGNAILSVKSNVEELTEAYKKEQEEARTSLMGKTDEILENSKRSVKEIEHDMGSMDNYGERLDELSKLIQKTDFTLEDLSFFDNGGFEYHGNYGVTTQYDQLTDLLRNAGIKDSYKYNTGSGLVDYFTNISDTDKARLQAFIKEEKAAYTESLKQRKELVDAYFKEALFGEYDSKISDNVKSSISNIIDTIDNDTLKSLDSAESIQEFVDKLLTPFTNLSDENQDKLELGVRLTTEWNNNEISYEEYVQKIQDFNALLEELFPGDENAETRRTFKILFDIPEDEELKSQVSTITNRRERVLYNKGSNPYEGVQKTEGQKQGSKVYDEWVQGLKTEDQAFVSKLSEKSLELTIDFTTEKDFNQWLEELQAEADKHKITLTTDLVSDLDTFEDKIDSLATAYESAVTNATYVAASDLQSLNDDFGGMKDDDGNYTAMASSIEKFNDTVTQNIGNTDGINQTAVNELLTSYLDLSGTLENLIDEGEDYAKQVLENQGVENSEEVVTSRLNKTYKTTRANLVKLSEAMNQTTKSGSTFLDVLESGVREGEDFDDVCTGLVDSVKNLVGIYNQETGELEGTWDDIIDADFVEANIEDIIGAFTGVEGSLDSLYAKVAALNAEQVWIDAGLDDTELDSKMTSIRAMLDIASTWTMEPEALLEDSQFMSALNDCWDSSVETANAINAALSTIGMKVQYKKTTNKIRVAKGSDSNAHTVYGGANAGKVMTADIIEVDDFEIVATPTGKGTTGSNANYTGSPSSSSNSGGSGDGSDSSSNSEETFDWIEVAIDRLENNLDKLSETIDDTYDDWESRNEAIKKSIDEVNKEIGLQQEGAEEYLKKAESIDLSEDWKKKVREGKIEIDTVSDDTLKTNIQNYQTWWEKYQDAMDKSKTLTQTIKEYYKTLFDNVASQYDQLLDNISSKTELIDERISRMEEHGYFVDEQYYKKQQSLEEENQKTLVKERAKLIEKLEDAVSKGTIKKGSESWQDMYQKIQDVNKQIEESKTKMVELNNAIRQLRWDKFDFIMEGLKDINEEASFLQNLFEDKNKFKNNVTVKGDSKKYSNGEFSNVGLATAALTVSRYEEDLREATRYKNEIDKINTELAKDGKKNDQELINRKKELVSAYRESIEAAKQEKQAIVSLVQEAFEKHLEALQALINKYTESLNAAKDLYDYQKSVTDQTKNLAKLQKQLAAYENDDSEGARKKRLELQQQLDSAQQELQETQWDRYISETSDALNKVYEDYENYLNEQLENVDERLKKIIEEINNNPENVAKAFKEIYKEWGLDEKGIQYFDWNSTDNMQSTLVTAFDASFKNYAKKWDTTKTEIGDIHSTLKDMLVEITNSNNDANGNTTNNEKAETKTNGKGKTVTVGNQSMNLKETATGNVKLTPTGSTKEDKNFLQDEKNKAKEIADNEKQKSKTESKTKVTPKNAWWRGKWYDAKGKVVSKYSLGQFVWDSTGQWYRYAVAGNKEWQWEKDCSRTIDGKIYYFNSDGYVIQGKTKKAPGYAKGTSNVPEDQLAWTQEQGSEFIYRTTDGAILTPLNQGDMVFTNEMSQRLWEIAKGNIPTGSGSIPHINTTINSGDANVNASISITLPNVQNYDQFKKELQNDNNFEKFVQEITIGQLNGNNTLNKRKY